MEKVMTEDVVNEICKAYSEALDNADKFSIFEGEVRKIYDDDEMSGFYPHGEPITANDLSSSLSIDSRIFLNNINFFKDDMALVFFIEDDTIKMHFCIDSWCIDSWDGFQSELDFTFKKTFGGDLFD